MQRQENISIKDVKDSVVIQYFIFNNPTEISIGPEFRRMLAFAGAQPKILVEYLVTIQINIQNQTYF